jgi:poly(3-hydroxybutyrate) depolymerase
MLQPKIMIDALDRSFSVRLDCHYLLRVPTVVDARTPLVLTLHGSAPIQKPCFT